MSAVERDRIPGPAARIRPLHPDDLGTIQRIERESYTVPWSESTFRSLILRTDADLLCAEVAGLVVGYAVCWYIMDQGELGNVAVDEPWRRSGIGEQLVRAMLERATKRGAREVFLEVRRGNVVAQRLYRRVGFREIGLRKNYYVKPIEDALVMRMLLR